jgi:hypothetical protein
VINFKTGRDRYKDAGMVEEPDEVVEISQEQEETDEPKEIELAAKGEYAIKPAFNPWAKKINEEEAKALINNMKNLNRPSGFLPEPDPKRVILKISEIRRDGMITILFN